MAAVPTVAASTALEVTFVLSVAVRLAQGCSMLLVTVLSIAAAGKVSLLGPLMGRFLPIFTDFSGFLGRLQPSKTTIQKTPDALGVEESSSPRRVLRF